MGKNFVKLNIPSVFLSKFFNLNKIKIAKIIQEHLKNSTFPMLSFDLRSDHIQ
jgi:hypothetical protein